MEKHFVRIIDSNGDFIEDAFVDELTKFTIETPCPDGFYLPKWDGTQWVEGKTVEEMAEIVGIATTETDAKALALSAIEKATTIASLRNAMLNYIEVSGVN